MPQMETPILHVTMEDTKRFGTTMEPLQTSALPPVKVEPATAKTIAIAEPEPAVRETTAPAKLLGDRIALQYQVRSSYPRAQRIRAARDQQQSQHQKIIPAGKWQEIVHYLFP